MYRLSLPCDIVDHAIQETNINLLSNASITSGSATSMQFTD